HHTENSETKCPKCYSSLPADEKQNYLRVLRHYIHLGFPERFETCNECSVSLASVRNFASCRDCPEILEKFLNYLGRTGDTSWTWGIDYRRRVERTTLVNSKLIN
ncbi:hypothetical protein ALC60_13595, partial [Trachymyrmex zeteki]